MVAAHHRAFADISVGEVAIGDGRVDISGGREGNGQLLIVSVVDVDALHARIVSEAA